MTEYRKRGAGQNLLMNDSLVTAMSELSLGRKLGGHSYLDSMSVHKYTLSKMDDQPMICGSESKVHTSNNR